MLKGLSIAVILLVANQCSKVTIDQPEITESELKQHIEYLSSDELQGRYPGTEGDVKAAFYIREHFRGFGLQLPGKEGYQPFQITMKVEAGSNNTLSFNGFKAKMKDEFVPYGFSAKAELYAPVVFAGYGIQAKTDSAAWDDYKGIDLKGKWCLIMRGTPELKHNQALFSVVPSDRDKAMLAEDLGVAGVLMVSGPEFDPKDELVSLSYKEGTLKIPVIHIHRTIADKLLKSSKLTIESIEKQIREGEQPVSATIPGALNASADVDAKKVTTENVVGILPGNDPVLKNEIIVIGAHFDHLGMGGFGSNSRVPDTIAVHHGADDNASGVASLIELAEKFASKKQNLKRTIVFIAFAAEEQGLLGSKYFVDNPLVDLKNVKAMINLDMVGRFRDDHSLQVNGTGTSLEAEGLLKSLNSDSSFHYAFSPEGYGPSDHSSFYAKNIPVIYFTTGAHVDYHTPADDVSKINFQGQKKVSDLVYELAMNLDNRETDLTFREAGPKTQVTGRQRLKVTFGIMPDFTSTDNTGLRADFVTPGKPAAKAGMLKGDLIVTINGKPVNNIQDYMYRLSKLNAGELVNVEVMRNGKKELLIIQL